MYVWERGGIDGLLRWCFHSKRKRGGFCGAIENENKQGNVTKVDIM